MHQCVDCRQSRHKLESGLINPSTSHVHVQITGYKIMGKQGEAGFVALEHCPPLSIVKADSKWVRAIINLLSGPSDTPVKDKVRLATSGSVLKVQHVSLVRHSCC